MWSLEQRLLLPLLTSVCPRFSSGHPKHSIGIVIILFHFVWSYKAGYPAFFIFKFQEQKKSSFAYHFTLLCQVFICPFILCVPVKKTKQHAAGWTTVGTCHASPEALAPLRSQQVGVHGLSRNFAVAFSKQKCQGPERSI